MKSIEEIQQEINRLHIQVGERKNKLEKDLGLLMQDIDVYHLEEYEFQEYYSIIGLMDEERALHWVLQK